MSTPRHVVLNLGMPRSGTTLTQKMLERGSGYFHQKICEHNPFHSMQGQCFVDLVNVFRRKIVVVVRTERDVDDVVESMRVGVEMGNRHPWDEAEVRRLHKQEAANWEAVTETLEARLERTIRCHTFTVPYEVLGTGERRAYLEGVASRLPHAYDSLTTWTDFLSEHWGTKPVNVGRLMREVGDPLGAG